MSQLRSNHFEKDFSTDEDLSKEQSTACCVTQQRTQVVLSHFSGSNHIATEYMSMSHCSLKP